MWGVGSLDLSSVAGSCAAFTIHIDYLVQCVRVPNMGQKCTITTTFVDEFERLRFEQSSDFPPFCVAFSSVAGIPVKNNIRVSR